jgi:hypothetical protein
MDTPEIPAYAYARIPETAISDFTDITDCPVP